MKKMRYILVVTMVLLMSVQMSVLAVSEVPSQNKKNTQISSKENGSENYPWRIDSASELEDVLEQMSKGKKLDDAFQLTKDITLDSTIPDIGTFSGVFDGGGYTIEIKNNHGLPLFGINQGAIQNLSLVLEDKILTKDHCNDDSGVVSGVIAIENHGTIDNCFVSADMNVQRAFNQSFGLMVAYNRGSIQDCGVTGEILVPNGGLVADFGGIAGSNEKANLESELSAYRRAGQILNCSSSVNVKIEGNAYPNGSSFRMGGIVGWNGGVIEDCTAQTFLMSALDAYNIGSNPVNYIYQGGIAGINADVGTVQGCTASGSLYATSYFPAKMYLNGISGLNNGTSKDNINRIGNSDVEQSSGSSAWMRQTEPSDQNLASDGKPNCILCRNTGLRDCIYCRGAGSIVDPFYSPLKDSIVNGKAVEIDCFVCHGTGKVDCLCGR